LSWQKGTKNRRLPSSGPYAALRGPLAPALLPGARAAGPIHGASALDGHPCPSSPSAMPPLGLLKSQSASPELPRALEARSKARSEFGDRPAPPMHSVRFCPVIWIRISPAWLPSAWCTWKNAVALALALAFASKRAVVQAMQIATSGGRAQGLRREVTGMDARQALGPRMGPAARSSRELARSEGTPERSVGAG